MYEYRRIQYEKHVTDTLDLISSGRLFHKDDRAIKKLCYNMTRLCNAVKVNRSTEVRQVVSEVRNT